MFYAQILINGILLGSLYGLMALGMALVWGVLNIVNLAHGSLIMLGGYAVYYLFTIFGIDPFLALPIAMLMMFFFGYLIQRYIINFIVRSELLNTLLITFGLDVVFTYLAQLAFSADFRTINPGYAGSKSQSGRGRNTVCSFGGFRDRSRPCRGALVAAKCNFLGSGNSSNIQNLIAARLYGIAPSILYPVTFGIGAALAGAAGGLFGMVGQLTPYIGAELTAKSFVIAIIGSLDNPFRVVLGGCIIGIAKSFGAVYFGSTYINVISFGLLVLILVLRPARSLRAA